VKDLSAAVMLTIEGESGVEASHRPPSVMPMIEDKRGVGASHPRSEKRSAPSGDVSQQEPVPASVDDSPLQIFALIRDELESRGRKELKAEGFSLDGLTTETFFEMRYAGQSYELSIPVDSLAPGAIIPAFHAVHHERYGHSDATRRVEVVTLRLKLVLPPAVGATGSSPQRSARRTTSVAGKRTVWFDGNQAPTPVYDRAELRPGTTIGGPAVVVQMDSTTVVPPGWRGEVDAIGNLVLERV